MSKNVNERTKNIISMMLEASDLAEKEGTKRVTIPCRFCGGEVVYERFEPSGFAMVCKNGCFNSMT